jgi:hypothetical protein
MNYVKIVLLLSFFVVMVCSCSRAGHAVNPEFASQAIDVWLDSKMTSEPKADLTGKWDAGSAFSGGWGEGNFLQEKGKFFGPLGPIGMYNIKGVVSGTDVYFVLMSNGTFYYSGAMSKKGDGSFFGKAVKGVFIDSEAAKSAEAYPIYFNKMN